MTHAFCAFCRELRICVTVEVAVLDSPFPIILAVSVDVKQYKKNVPFVKICEKFEY